MKVPHVAGDMWLEASAIPCTDEMKWFPRSLGSCAPARSAAAGVTDSPDNGIKQKALKSERAGEKDAALPFSIGSTSP